MTGIHKREVQATARQLRAGLLQRDEGKGETERGKSREKLPTQIRGWFWPFCASHASRWRTRARESGKGGWSRLPAAAWSGSEQRKSRSYRTVWTIEKRGKIYATFGAMSVEKQRVYEVMQKRARGADLETGEQILSSC